MRRLTLEEAERVTEHSREEGERPQYYDSESAADREISPEFEAYLILTPISTRSSVSDYFQVILDNDPNQVQLRDQLLGSFLDDEMENEQEHRRRFTDITDVYDDTRASLSDSLEGFSDIDEAVRLQESMTNSLGGIVHARDRHHFNTSALKVLKTRLEAEGLSELHQELQSWVRVLVEYD